MSIIAGASFFISNSTGPLHIARAFNIPLLAFYCPAIPCSPERWGPYNQKDSIITPDIIPCKSCNIDKCPYGNCLNLISWSDIQKRLERLLV
jgi:heptosyltransferase-2